MAYIPKEEYPRPRCVAMRVKEVNLGVMPRITDTERRQYEQDRIAAQPSTFVNGVLKRDGNPHPCNVHMFPEKRLLDHGVLHPEPVEYKPWAPKHYQAPEYRAEAVATISNDDARKDHEADRLWKAKQYSANFSPQRLPPMSKAMRVDEAQAPPIPGFKTLGTHSLDPVPNQRIKKSPFDSVTPPWLVDRQEEAHRVQHKPNPCAMSTVGTCLNYTDGYNVPDMVPMPKNAIEIQRWGGNLVENPNQIHHVQRHRRLVPGQGIHANVSAPSPAGARILSRRETTMQLFFANPKECTPPPPHNRRAYTSMLP